MKCLVCNKEMNGKPNKVTCSDKCRKIKSRCDGEMAFVYVIDFKDGMVKVGMSKDPLVRSRAVELVSGRFVNEIWFSKALNRSDARKVESEIHSKLSVNSVIGEWFNCSNVNAISIAKDVLDDDIYDYDLTSIAIDNLVKSIKSQLLSEGESNSIFDFIEIKNYQNIILNCGKNLKEIIEDCDDNIKSWAISYALRSLVGFDDNYNFDRTVRQIMEHNFNSDVISGFIAGIIHHVATRNKLMNNN